MTPPPFGTFPKIHPFWWGQSSLTWIYSPKQHKTVYLSKLHKKQAKNQHRQKKSTDTFFSHLCLITLTKHKKLNLGRRPCEEDPTYSFITCTKEKLSQKIGCRLPWDRWSKQDRKVCNSENEFKQYEDIYIQLYLVEFDEIEDIVGCTKPCSYNEFKFVYTSPEALPSHAKNLVAIGAASRKTFIEKEVLHYPLTSFIAEFGGALGLFLGFSFMTIWQEIRACFCK